MRIEKRYTKEEIFTFYCNQIYLGHGAYGVEAASQLYFRKPAKELKLHEAATIAGIIQGNVRQSPFVNPRQQGGDATMRSSEWPLNVSDARAAATQRKPVVAAGDHTGEAASHGLIEESASISRRNSAPRHSTERLTVRPGSTAGCSRPQKRPSSRLAASRPSPRLSQRAAT